MTNVTGFLRAAHLGDLQALLPAAEAKWRPARSRSADAAGPQAFLDVAAGPLLLKLRAAAPRRGRRPGTARTAAAAAPARPAADRANTPPLTGPDGPTGAGPSPRRCAKCGELLDQVRGRADPQPGLAVTGQVATDGLTVSQQQGCRRRRRPAQRGSPSVRTGSASGIPAELVAPTALSSTPCAPCRTAARRAAPANY